MMPEAPEVQTVLETLEPQLTGREIVHAEIHHPKLASNLPPEDFTQKLTRQHFRRFDRKGKYLILELDDYVWIVHLRMEGKFFLLDSRPDPKDKHQHALFDLDDGRCLVYQDTRKFGRMALFEKGQETAMLDEIGPDLLKGECDRHKPEIYQKFKRKAPVKAVLLDQSVLSGIGNIYADEILFKSHIHPGTKAKDLTEDEIDRLLETGKQILQTAAAHKGTTIRSYTSSLGVEGQYQDQLQIHLKDGQPCPVCGTPIEKDKIAQRGTYWCPTCQKEK